MYLNKNKIKNDQEGVTVAFLLVVALQQAGDLVDDGLDAEG